MSNTNTDVARIQSRFFGLTPKEQAKMMEDVNLAIQELTDAKADPKCLEAIKSLQMVAEDLMTYARTLASHERVIGDALARSQNQKEQRQSRQGGGSRRGGGRRPRKS
jgi:hypothetical protein